MRHIYFSFGLALTLGLSAAQAQTPTWTGAVAPTNPTPTDDTGAVGSGITIDAGNNQYVTGSLMNGLGSGAPATRVFGNTSLTGGSGYASGFVAKLSPTQQWLWALKATSNGEGVSFDQTAVSSAGDVYASGTAYDELSPNGGRVLTVGTYTYTTTKDAASFITRLNANGQPQWLAGVSGASIEASGWDNVAGNLVVVGEYSGSGVTFGSTTLPTAANDGFFVARLNAAGQWVSAVGVASAGTASSARFTVNDAVVGPQGQVAIAFRIRNTSLTLGSTIITSTSATQSKCIIAQISAANQIAWVVESEGTAGNTIPYAVNDLQYDRTGNVWLAAESFDTGLQLGNRTVGEDSFVARLSPTGQWGAVGTIGHSGNPNRANNTYALAADAQGNAVIVGDLPDAITYTFGSISLVNPTVDRNFVARFNPTTGNWEYAQLAPTVSTNGNYVLGDIALDAAGNLITSGSLQSGSVTFGSTTLTSPSSSGFNFFVAKLSNAGRPLGVRQVAGVAPLALYPNPVAAGAAATFRLPTAATVAQSLVLRDALGRVVRQATIAAGKQEVQLPTAGLAPGVYLAEAGLSRAQVVVE
ncbi:T9SS type A sorting domain-containing protein [Hymenobacter cellulosilyticus]|uniref:T9SS type A sorting domain-containing protein n=1 Tax=Hymenobacter cellulosilyticus TaxID=2932248 RepID=A0A8T9Q4H7_9BACT|nr:T9SS type A sorting domain-containing protein [Hymenobacter cellulosilyticus]UOQ71872.1 T9SS type A sorting domain-containing protein [Hymenobacter cellulosilyticus]